jgi:hypothetical protein
MSTLIKDRVNVSTQRAYTDEGFLIVSANIARTGIQEYFAFELGLTDRDPKEKVRVYRPADEVFDEISMASFANKTLTDDHPAVLVDSTNAKELSVGHSGPAITRDNIFLQATLHFTDATAIKNVEEGKVELSNGYTSDMEMVTGVTPDGDQYDAIQRNIRGNHIALVDKGRCGPACKVSDHSPDNEDRPMPKAIVIDGVDFEVTDQVAQAVSKLQRRLTDMEEKAKTDDEEEAKKKEDEEEEAKKKEDEMEEVKKDYRAKVDTLQAKLDSALSSQPTPEQLDTLVDNRIATRDAAIKINPAFKFAGKDCETIRKEIVADACADIDIKTVSADYIRARFDGLVSTAPASVSNNSIDAALASQARRTDSVQSESGNVVKDARAAFAERNRNAWNPGGAK